MRDPLIAEIYATSTGMPESKSVSVMRRVHNFIFFWSCDEAITGRSLDIGNPFMIEPKIDDDSFALERRHMAKNRFAAFIPIRDITCPLLRREGTR